MAGGEGSGDDASSLVYAPTWAVASVCFIFILVSLLAERIIHGIGHLWKSHQKMSLYEALEKVKEELMVVGFISLALTVGQYHVTKVCVPVSWTNKMRQCKLPSELVEKQHAAAAPPPGQSCADKEKADFITVDSLHQLHIFLFALAMIHVAYSVVTVGLGMWKVRLWRALEDKAVDLDFTAHGGARYAKDTTFIKRHAAGVWSKNFFLAYIAAFFQQFYRSVRTTDYLTLRHGFIRTHKLQNFNFHMYIVKSMEKDFKHVVGISPLLWGYMVLLLLLNVEGWGTLYWASLLPFLAVLAVGTKLRYIITQMAVRSLDKYAVVVDGIPTVKPSDDLFWFGRPKLVLSLIHFILFQTSLEVAVHLWSKLTFDKPNCFNRSGYLLTARVILGFLTQVLCGCVVLPIYALVSQMGSSVRNYKEIELCIRKSPEDGSEDSTRGHKEGNVLLGAGSLNSLQIAQLGNGHSGGDRGEDSIVDFDDNQDGRAHAERKMSMVERVARGVHGESYYELKPGGTAQGGGHAHTPK